MSHAELVFAGHALGLRRHGLAVVPIGRDRTPAVSRFSKWSRPPSERTVAKWAEQHPAHNIALIPGLSNIWVADADAADQVPVLEEMLEPTPLRVNTNRGKHLYYRKPAEWLPSSLRAIGLNVDLKAATVWSSPRPASTKAADYTRSMTVVTGRRYGACRSPMWRSCVGSSTNTSGRCRRASCATCATVLVSNGSMTSSAGTRLPAIRFRSSSTWPEQQTRILPIAISHHSTTMSLSSALSRCGTTLWMAGSSNGSVEKASLDQKDLKSTNSRA